MRQLIDTPVSCHVTYGHPAYILSVSYLIEQHFLWKSCSPCISLTSLGKSFLVFGNNGFTSDITCCLYSTQMTSNRHLSLFQHVVFCGGDISHVFFSFTILFKNQTFRLFACALTGLRNNNNIYFMPIKCRKYDQSWINVINILRRESLTFLQFYGGATLQIKRLCFDVILFCYF